jgi:nucleoside-diphosphate-sugar epimerase
VMRLFGSAEQIIILTGWKPAYTFEEGLDATIEWFRDKSNLARYKADIYNL